MVLSGLIDIFKEKLANRDIRTLLENFISLSALQVVSIIVPLITLPYLLRVLGTFNYGTVVLAFSLINYFITITDYSFRVTATREVSIHRGNLKSISLIYSRVMLVKMALCVMSLIIISLIVWFYKPFFAESNVFFLTAPIIVGYALFPEWFFQGIEKMKYITIFNVSIKVFFAIGIFLFIKKPEDYWLYPLFQSLGFLISGIIGQYVLISKYKLKIYWIGFSRMRKTLVDNYPIFINQFMPNLYNNTSTFLLGVIIGNSSVGTYDAIKKIAELGVTLIGIVSRVFFPYLNRVKEAFSKFEKSMLLCGLVLTLGPIIFYKLIFWYLAIDYEYAFGVLTILSISIFVITLYEIYGLNYFIVMRMDRLVMKNTFVASIIGFVSAFPLIYYFGIVGAALNLTLSRAIMGGGLFYKFKKMKQDENSNS
ncbi:oligosaccharide flippase family protein [Marinifilum sp. D737]|uniref:oligosaccharide flippase family protein n=1 Tax=Marinifilum sp. D737 TaxID=2969628 RepID=UPI002273E260|nr:oligosaccharide flippase family protein [Marinifilum sp. D737]MCY1634889.1 oligosaccharide flippase family protein [Marinifilum sp. D737]